MNIGDKVKVIDNENPFYDKSGYVESIDNDVVTVMIDFIPEQHKRVRQYFNESQLETVSDTIDDAEQEYMQESISTVNESENNGILDSKSNDVELKKKLLADYLGTYTEDIFINQEDDNFFEFEDDTYLVCTEVEAYRYAEISLEDCILNNGLYDTFKPYFIDWVIKNAVSKLTLEDLCEKYLSNKYNDLSDEEVVEVAENTLDDNDIYNLDDYENKDDFLDYYREKLVENDLSNIDDYAEFVLFNYDKRYLCDYIEDEYSYNEDKVVKQAIKENGISYYLHCYEDGIKLSDKFNLYQIN